MEETSDVTSRNGSRGGLRDEQAEHVSTNVQRLGCAKQLKMATWNCGGLQDEVKQLCSDLEYDILGITETQYKGLAPSSSFIPAEPAPENDSYSGVALMLSQSVSKCVIFSGCIGSRIVYVPQSAVFLSSVFMCLILDIQIQAEQTLLLN